MDATFVVCIYYFFLVNISWFVANVGYKIGRKVRNQGWCKLNGAEGKERQVLYESIKIKYLRA